MVFREAKCGRAAWRGGICANRKADLRGRSRGNSSKDRGFQLALPSRTFQNAAVRTSSVIITHARRAAFGFADCGRRRLRRRPMPAAREAGSRAPRRYPADLHNRTDRGVLPGVGMPQTFQKPRRTFSRVPRLSDFQQCCSMIFFSLSAQVKQTSSADANAAQKPLRRIFHLYFYFPSTTENFISFSISLRSNAPPSSAIK